MNGDGRNGRLFSSPLLAFWTGDHDEPDLERPDVPSSLASTPPKGLLMTTAVLFADGACRPNPGRGGWAFIARTESGGEFVGSGALEHSTNNRAELTAIIEGLNALPPQSAVTVYTDSRNAIAWSNPKRRKRLAAQPWPEGIEAYHVAAGRHGRVSLQWIKGHNGHPDHDECDRLANAAAA